MKAIDILRRVVRNSDKSVQLLDKTAVGIDNQSRLLNGKLQELIEGVLELHKEVATIRELLGSGRGGDLSTIQAPPVQYSVQDSPPQSERPKAENASFDAAVASLPLMIDTKTYNTSHPDYDANLVRNYPGKIFNAEKSSNNIVYTPWLIGSINGGLVALGIGYLLPTLVDRDPSGVDVSSGGLSPGAGKIQLHQPPARLRRDLDKLDMHCFR